jgi:hypothetical protein
MVGVAEALTAATAAFGLAKQIVSVDHELDKASLKLKAADLMEALATAKAGLVDAREELRDKDDQLARLRETMKRHAATVEHEGYTYEAGPDGKPIGLPYCPRCCTKGRTLMRIIKSDMQYWANKCPQCNVDYKQARACPYSHA